MSAELVIGLVGAIGTDLRAVAESLQRQLSAVDYTSSTIRVSGLLHDLRDFAHLANVYDQEEYYERHMNAGNAVRERLDMPDAMARLSVLQIRSARTDHNMASDPPDIGPLNRHAFIVNSLKRPEEIRLLKEVYGDAFVLLASYAARDTRRDTLAARIAKSKNKEASDCRHIAERLIDRDEGESGEFGQDVSDTFFRGDAFIDASEKADLDDAVRRFVEILFGHPFQTPNRDELGMHHAFASALRSADVSRQVGAAICTEDGQVLAVGTNEVPKAGGGLYWGDGEADGRDFRFADTDEPNAEMKLIILSDLLERLKTEKYLREDLTIIDPAVVGQIASHLGDSRLMGITEYGRQVHAEMAAITDAARRGISIQGTTLYCTTFPCHNCAKHIVAAGIAKVIYIEPYPKSQVQRLFPDSIAVDRRPKYREVLFSPFVGFAPTRFADFFVMRERRDASKHILRWESISTTAEPRVKGIPGAYLTEEVRTIKQLQEAMSKATLRFIEKGGDE